MRKFPVVLCAALLLGLARTALPTLAAPAAPPMTPAQIQAKCTEIDQKCAEAAKTIEDLQALKSSLMQQLGEAAPPPAVTKASWAEKIAVSGYMQNRYEWFQDHASGSPFPQGPNEFQLRRMYVNFLIKPNDRTQAVITLARDGGDVVTPNWAQAYVDYKLSPTDTFRMGRASTQFGLEMSQSSSVRLPFERSSFIEGGRGRPVGMFPAGPYDNGVWLIHTPAPNPCGFQYMPQFIFGATDGNFKSDTKNDNLTLEGDLKWTPKWGIFGVSWLNGEFTGTNPLETTPSSVQWGRNALDGYVRYVQPKNWALQAEGLTGRFLDSNVGGWDVQAEKMLRSTPGTFYGRYESYDPDRDSNHKGDIYYASYKAIVLGYAHQLDTNNRLTLQATIDAQRDSIAHNEAGVQWQLGF